MYVSKWNVLMTVPFSRDQTGTCRKCSTKSTTLLPRWISGACDNIFYYSKSNRFLLCPCPFPPHPSFRRLPFSFFFFKPFVLCTDSRTSKHCYSTQLLRLRHDGPDLRYEWDTTTIETVCVCCVWCCVCLCAFSMNLFLHVMLWTEDRGLVPLCKILQ